TPDGDKVTITSSLGAAAVLVILQDPVEGFSIVERGVSSLPHTLTVTTSPTGGSGISKIHGIALNPSGPVTIAAAHSDLLGDVQIGGTLTALTVGNIGTAAGPPLRITAAGAGPTTFAAREVVNTAVNLRGNLTSLTAASVTNSSFTANAFGTITTTGIPAAGNR